MKLSMNNMTMELLNLDNVYPPDSNTNMAIMHTSGVETTLVLFNAAWIFVQYATYTRYILQ
jgi:hypothetical protein